MQTRLLLSCMPQGDLPKEQHRRWLVLPDTILWGLGKGGWHETVLVGNKKLQENVLMLARL